MKVLFICLLCNAQLVWLVFSSVADQDKCCRDPDASTLDCSGCRLENISYILNTNITTLNLNNNLIKDIKGFAFTNLTSLKVLSIRYNQLRTINNHSFAGLRNLETLDTTQTDEYIIPTEAFKPLISLKTLRLGKICTAPDLFPKEVFVHVSPGLHTLELSVPLNFVFGNEFVHLRNLHTLVLFGHSCSLRTVSIQTFAVFAKTLQTLEVHDCEATKVDPNFLKNFVKLETLNVACNRQMKLDELFEAVKHMPSSTLHTIIADGVHSGMDFNELKPKWFNSSRFENLKRLSLRQTNIISFDTEFVYFIPRLEFFNFGFNTILQSKHSNRTDLVKLVSFLNKCNLTSVDISYFGQPVSEGNIFRKKYCRDADMQSADFFRQPPAHIVIPDPVPCCNHTLIFNGSSDDILSDNVPQSLLFVYAGSLGFPQGETDKVQFNSDNNVLFLDFSNTRIRRVNNVFIGLTKLQGFDLSGCGIEYVHPELLDHLPSLTFLNMSRNELSGTPWDRFFNNAQNIRILDLSSNRLESVPANISKGWVSLESIFLNNNPLGRVVINLDNNKKLSMLDLRNTSLIPSSKFTEKLDNFQSRINHTLQLRLQGTIFQCDCSNLDFLKWLKETNVDIIDKETLQCDYNKRRHYISAVDVYDLEYVCTERMRLLTMILTPIASVVAVLVFVVLVHNYRWSIKWRFYLVRRSFFYKRLQRQDGAMMPLVTDNVSYHAFVSYNHNEDYQWIQDSLLQKVEEEWGLKLCIGQRDFIPGIPIAENICEAIDNSRYIILVVTPAFVSSNWCDFEMHMALVKGRQHMIIIYKQEVDPDKMSRSLRSLMSSLNYIEYSETPDGKALFWTRLRDRLTSHIDPVDT